MALEQWIRQHLQQTVRDPWPHGNGAFCELLETLIQRRQQKAFIRFRGQGTTTLLQAAALYAASEALTPYVLLVCRDLDAAQRLEESLCWLAEEAGLFTNSRRQRLELVNAGVIESCSIRGSFSGLTARVQGGIVRPSLILLDLGEMPRSPTEQERLKQLASDCQRFHSELSPCGIATVTSVEGQVLHNWL